MNKYFIKLGTAVTSAAMLVSSFVVPALAVDVEISGNGANSDNNATVVTDSNTTVNQTNYANITNDVNVDANTGHNDANNNTGGDVSIDTGDANANVDIANTANANIAQVDACCPKDINVTISDNGADSDNDANVVANTTVNLDQDNTAKIKNKVDVDLDTGHNDANNNTGGNVTITTGDAAANGGVVITNTVNKNVASVGSGQNGGGSLSVWISGNGANSNNTANVIVNSTTNVSQTNYANIKNDVDVDLNTGHNDANNNTGGDVSIDTGDATAQVDISNLANFNWADVDACGCIFDASIKIKGNGAHSDNDAFVALLSRVWVDQDNTYDCSRRRGGQGVDLFGEHGRRHHKDCNEVDVDLDTGHNDANNNTQDGEPEILTGDASADVIVDTTANKNIFGDADFDFEFPELDLGEGSSSALLLWLLAIFS